MGIVVFARSEAANPSFVGMAYSNSREWVCILTSKLHRSAKKRSDAAMPMSFSRFLRISRFNAFCSRDKLSLFSSLIERRVCLYFRHKKRLACTLGRGCLRNKSGGFYPLASVYSSISLLMIIAYYIRDGRLYSHFSRGVISQPNHLHFRLLSNPLNGSRVKKFCLQLS